MNFWRHIHNIHPPSALRAQLFRLSGRRATTHLISSLLRLRLGHSSSSSAETDRPVNVTYLFIAIYGEQQQRLRGAGRRGQVERAVYIRVSTCTAPLGEHHRKNETVIDGRREERSAAADEAKLDTGPAPNKRVVFVVFAARRAREWWKLRESRTQVRIRPDWTGWAANERSTKQNRKSHSAISN